MNPLITEDLDGAHEEALASTVPLADLRTELEEQSTVSNSVAQTSAPLPDVATQAPDGISVVPPLPPALPLDDIGSGVDLVSLDPLTQRADPLAMPGEPLVDELPSNPSTPVGSIVPPSLDADLAEETIATPAGDTPPSTSVSPGAVAIALGQDPDFSEAAANQSEETLSGDNQLSATFKPRIRPSNLIERYERARFGGRTLAELNNLQPRLRPISAQIAAAADATPTEQAIESSRKPIARPDDIATMVAAVRASEAAAQAQAVAAASTAGLSASTPSPAETAQRAPVSGPSSIPTRAEVAREATINDVLRMNRMNLIGVYGADAERRALIRMPSGRLVKVKVGDRIDGGQIAVIGDNNLRYTKGGQNITLTIPSG